MSRRHAILIEQHGDHLHVDTRRLPFELRPFVVVALADELGLELPRLEKASGKGEGLDPRYPDLAALFHQFVATWSRWARWLASRLMGLFQYGRREDPNVSHELEQLFRQHEAGVIATTTGHTTDPGIVDALQRFHLVPASYYRTAPVPAAYALGLSRDPAIPARPATLEVPREPTPEAPGGRQPPTSPPPPAPQAPAPEPRGRPLSAREEAELAHVRSRAALYMKKPVSALQVALGQVVLEQGARLDRRALSPEERALVAGVIAGALLDKASVAETARRLNDAAAGTALTNDMMRVARTELHAAHCAGALRELKALVEPGHDPLVYKIVSPGACEQCRRIWGHPANPIRYKLSVVEAGENYGKPAKEWGPTVGPIHPNCTCPPLQLWNDEVHDAVQDVAAELRRVFGT